MIPKKILKDPEIADDFTRLGEYISAAPETGEKLDRFWIANCGAGETLEDLPAALAEIEAIRQQKPEIEDKTYHMMVSFRDSDREKLTDEVLKDIAAEFTKALGFEDHQYVAGTHINTNHFHMHLGINKVHPQTLHVKTPRRDFKTLERVARKMERKYGLAIDRGMSDRDLTQAPGLSPAAKNHEARTWEQSFQRWMIENRDTLLPEIQKAGTWQALHEGLARHRVQIKQQGAGLVFATADGQQTMKASAFDRSCSKGGLEKRLGTFEPPRQELALKSEAEPQIPRQDPVGVLTPPTGKGYRPRPLGRTTGTAALWGRYQRRRRAAQKDGVLDRSLRSWFAYVVAEAYRDPVAAVILMAQQEIMNAVIGNGGMVDQVLDFRPHPRVRISEASLRAVQVWREAAPWRDASARPAWAEAKGVMGGVKVDDRGNLVVPFRTPEGRIEGVRLVAEDGRTLDIGPVSRSSFHLIDPRRMVERARADRNDHDRVTSPVPVLIVSDYQGAVTLAQATRHPVAVARSAQDLDAVAEALKAQGISPIVVDHEHTQTARPGRLMIPRDAKVSDLRSLSAAVLGDQAQALWDTAKPAGRDSPVLAAQGVQSFGCREDDTGNLLVPLRTLSGRLEGVAQISPTGTQTQIRSRKGEQEPLACLIDPARQLGSGGPVLLAQSYMTGAALHRATRLPVVVVVADPGGWQATAEAVKAKWPASAVVVAMDDTPANRDQAKAADLPLVAPVSTSGRRVSYTDLTPPKAAETLRDTLADATKDAVWLEWRSGRTPERTDHPVMEVGTFRRGARIREDGTILLPLRNEHQRLSGVMAVSADGEVLHTLTDHRGPTPQDRQDKAPAPLSHVVGGFAKKGDTGPVIVARTPAEAVALHRETTATVVLARTPADATALADRLRGHNRRCLLAGQDLKVPELKGFSPPPASRKKVLRQALSAAALPMRQERTKTKQHGQGMDL
ncbi:TraI/MobA(P) family conjugative relaxase [Novispirillum itersonii]|uniref:TraI/MobA(P) family conjugative relaxase n=1 Tax=Novispirillum itersonii TaxID=189 RepID=UPI000370FBDC|nr:TraI/MobA(P) family conjugative relaxase [Novispirillum itersonii]